MRTLALPKEVEHWSLTTLREKLVKIGAKVVRHGRYVTFQLAEVAVPRELFLKILSLIDDLRPRPAPAQVGEIGGRVKTTGEVWLDGENSDRPAFQARADLQNQAIGWLRKGYSSETLHCKVTETLNKFQGDVPETLHNLRTFLRSWLVGHIRNALEGIQYVNRE